MWSGKPKERVIKFVRQILIGSRNRLLKDVFNLLIGDLDLATCLRMVAKATLMVYSIFFWQSLKFFLY